MLEKFIFMIIKNGTVLDENFKFVKKDICTNDDLISISSSDNSIIDAKGLLVLPGLFDMHFHGASSHDFMEGTKEALGAILKYEALSGVTSVTPATMTMSEDDIAGAVSAAKSFTSDDSMSSIEGVYMEGPFISPKKCGAQNSAYIRKPDIAFFEKVNEKSGSFIRTVVVAPECEGALSFIENLKDEVLISIGHTACGYDTALKAYSLGANGLTHSFNAMDPMLHRAPGPIGAAFDSDNVFMELIADGIHIHDSVIRTMFKICPKRICLISDSMMAAGLKDGEYSLGGQKVLVNGKTATLEDGTLAGSVTNLFDCMKHAYEAGVPLEDAVRAASFNPARKLHLEDKIGSIREGNRADLLITDEKLNLKHVIVRGKMLY